MADGSGPDSNTLTIRWVGDLYAHHSLATVSRELICTLASFDDLRFVLAPTDSPPYPTDSVAEMEAIPTGVGACDVEVRHHWPPDFTPKTMDVPLVMIQPWEHGGMPASWIDPIIKHIDQVWAPTSWVRECYVASGIPEHLVEVVPNGVNTSAFSPDGYRYPLSTCKATKLLFLGGTIKRKGADVLLDAYCSAFGPQDDVCLVVKVFRSDAEYKDRNLDHAFRQAAADPTLPEIEVIDTDLTRQEVASVYRACDALVHPYRGEGFGLPIAEAMACGLPVVATGYGACLDFCDSSSAYLLPYSLQPISLEGMAPSPVGFWWAQPDKDALIESMRTLVSSPEEAHSKGIAGRNKIVSGFTWEMAAQKAYALLSNLANGVKIDHTPAHSSAFSPTTASGFPATVQASDRDAASIPIASRISSLASMASKALSDLNSRAEEMDSHVTQLDDNVRMMREQQLLLLIASKEYSEGTTARPTMASTEDLDSWRIGYLETFIQEKQGTAQNEPPLPVLVVGSGSQSLLDHLATKGIPATNIASEQSDSVADVDPDELRHAYTLLEASGWQCIAILEGIERFNLADIIKLISDFKRALIPSGMLILEATDPVGITYPEHPASGTASTDMNRLWIPPAALANLLMQAGFTGVKVSCSPSSSRYAVLAVS